MLSLQLQLESLIVFEYHCCGILNLYTSSNCYLHESVSYVLARNMDADLHACSMCPYFTERRISYVKHVLNKHKHHPSFIIHCTDCGAAYRQYASFARHIQRKHRLVNHEDESTDTDNALETVEVEAVEHGETPREVRSEAVWLLKLLSSHRVSARAVRDIVESVNDLFTEKLMELVPQIEAAHGDTAAIRNITTAKLFDGLVSKNQQEKYFEEHMSYIKPKAVILGSRLVTRKRKSKKRLVEESVTGYTVPFVGQLQALLDMPEVQEVIHSSRLAKSEDLLLDFADGSYCKSHPFIIQHADALLFSIYVDDFEVANPIGSHKKKHKISIFYWILLNIPPEFRCKLSAIQLLAIAKTSDLRKFGTSKLLHDFQKSMQLLSKGLSLQGVAGYFTYHGILVAVQADTPAAQLIGGFKESVGCSYKPCRTCEVTSDDIHKSVTHGQFQLRNEQEHRDRVVWLNEQNQHGRIYWSKHYGINSDSILTNIPSFSLTQCILHDPMHILLEGIARVELKAMLNRFVYIDKFFSLKVLNELIDQYEYCEDEARDKPQIVDRDSLKPGGSFAQTASSMKVLITNLPYMIANFIPDSNLHWKTFLCFLRICVLSFSSVTTSDTAETLKHLIAWHNRSFVDLYTEQLFVPKMHFLTHLPEQMRMFGPTKNHSCMRFEAKNGFFKLVRWFNFKNLPLSLALHHQRWMCLQMCGGPGLSHTYLYVGDQVSEGPVVGIDSCDMSWKRALLDRYIRDGNTCVDDTHLMMSTSVTIKGHCYKLGSVLLLTYTDEPVFVEIISIVVVNQAKYFICGKMNTLAFDSHIDAFVISKSDDFDEVLVLSFNDLVYQWPQKLQNIAGKCYIGVHDVDDVWML